MPDLIRRTPRPIYLPNCPRFVFGTADLALSLPSTPRDYVLAPVGGDLESDAGVRAGFVVRRDEQWAFLLRFFESEWPAVQAFITYAQTGALFTYYPDALDTSVSYAVRLIEPGVGKTYAASPDSEYPIVQLLPITIVTRAVAAPVESGDDLPAGMILDYDAEDAITVTTGPLTIGGDATFPDFGDSFTYDGVVQVTSRLEGGPPMTILGERAGWHGGQPELNGHALIRAWGSSNNNPMFAQLPSAVAAPTGATLIVVHRPGHGISHGMPFEIGDGTGTFGGIGTLLALGIVSGVATIGGWRRGGLLSETGEFGATWGGTVFFEPTVYPTVGVPYHPNLSKQYQEFTPIRAADNIAGSPFNVSVIRINAFGQVTLFNNGTKLPFGFSAPAGPYAVRNVLMTSSAGGSLDLSGGQAWEWARVTVYAKWLTDREVKQASRILGRRFNIVVT